MNLLVWLERAARADPSRVALYRGDAVHVSYGELARSTERRAAGLRRLGLEAGDRVALVMKNDTAYIEALYAVWWAGLVAVPVNAKLHPHEVRFILEDSQAKAVFVTPDWRSGIGEATRGLEPAPQVFEAASRDVEALAKGAAMPVAPAAGDALAWLFYTSGTTGRPKGAMLSHRNLAQMTLGYFADVDRVEADGVLLHAAPISHGSGLYNFTHLAKGAAQAIPESGAFDADEVLALLERHERVSFFAAPTIVKRLAQAAASSGARAPGLQTLVYGGGPMYLPDIEQALELFGPRFAQIYGQGESPMTITALSKREHANRTHPRYLARLSSVGIPQRVVEVTVRAPSGDVLPPGVIGEVCVRGDVVMSGYWRNPEATASALRRGSPARGQDADEPWLWTGDLGAFDEEGFLTLKDRSKDLIVTGGSNVYPREVEEVLLRHPDVAEAAVVGRPDREWGESIVAFVVARGARPSTDALDRLCLEHIARFKRPREYRFVDALPKNNYGKVVKTQLRAQLESGREGEPT